MFSPSRTFRVKTLPKISPNSSTFSFWGKRASRSFHSASSPHITTFFLIRFRFQILYCFEGFLTQLCVDVCTTRCFRKFIPCEQLIHAPSFPPLVFFSILMISWKVFHKASGLRWLDCHGHSPKSLRRSQIDQSQETLPRMNAIFSWRWPQSAGAPPPRRGGSATN